MSRPPSNNLVLTDVGSSSSVERVALEFAPTALLWADDSYTGLYRQDQGVGAFREFSKSEMIGGLVSYRLSESLNPREQRFPEASDYAVEFRSGDGVDRPNLHPICTFLVQDKAAWQKLMDSDPYQVARAFITSKLDVQGDLVAAVRIFRRHFLAREGPSWRTLLDYLSETIRGPFQRGSTAPDICFHYDRSNEFYRCFLDSRMVYSCAYFRGTNVSLDEAQVAKLDHICRKLRLRPGHRFLDIGSGWGALVLHSADRFGTFSSGCTLSPSQFSFAATRIAREGLADRASVFCADYRKLSGIFDRIASVGMFEHVGHKSLDQYFATVANLLTADGLFLNHGIVRPSNGHTGPETAFLRRYVFPGGELVRLIDLVRSAEKAGLEIVDIENLRPHYALTCEAWVQRLIRHGKQCLAHVSVETYRVWLLYLAASRVAFETGETEVHQVLMSKRGSGARSLTRDYMYNIA